MKTNVIKLTIIIFKKFKLLPVSDLTAPSSEMTLIFVVEKLLNNI